MTGFDHAAALDRILALDEEINPRAQFCGQVHIGHSRSECGTDWNSRANILVCCRTYSNGSDNLWIMCSKCGSGRPIRRNLWGDLSELPSWSNVTNGLYEQWRNEGESRRAEEDAEIERKRQEQRSFYRSYLRTPEWAGRREKVMRRANRVCEACGEAKAEQVHHITYAHLGQEPLWELRAICRKCHERIHGIDREGAVDL